MAFIPIGGFDDYLGPALYFPRAHATAPTLKVFRGNIDGIAFAGTGALEETWANIHILHTYRAGTKVFPHIHWSHIVGAPSGDVVWQVEYSVSKGHSGGTFPAATTVELQQTAGAQYTHHIIETSTDDAIVSTEIEPDTVIMVRVFRDPGHENDTFEDDAFLLFIDMHFQSDGTLTNEKVRPFTKRMKMGEISV